MKLTSEAQAYLFGMLYQELRTVYNSTMTPSEKAKLSNLIEEIRISFMEDKENV